MVDVFANLNGRQRHAVESTEGRIKVVAGAGSGKTRVLAHRFAHLVNNYGIDPGNILCMTFTNKAAQEMRSRISRLVSPGNTNDFVCTIHGFCVKVLRRDIYRLGFPKTFTILDEEDGESLAKQVLDKFGMDRTKKTVKDLKIAVNEFKKTREDYISEYMLPESLQGKDTSKFNIIETYIHYQVKNYALDFFDIICFTLHILHNFDEVRLYWQEKLNYIMVDEVQDCNGPDWAIMKIMSARYNNLFIVGDPDQAIYEWRGAVPDAFIEWECDEEIILAENYRSTPNILDVANSVISNNKSRIPKNLYTSKPSLSQVVHYHAENDAKEAEWIVKQIEKLVAGGAEYSDFAILFRASYLSRAIEQALLKKQVPYVIWGTVRFFERKEIKDSISYLRLIANNDDLAFSRIVNTPSRKFGDISLKKLKEYSEQENKPLFNILKEHLDEWKSTKAFDSLRTFIRLIEECRELREVSSISELLNYVLKESGLTDCYRNDQDVDRLENIEELISSIRYYEMVNEDNDITLENYLQDIALYTNADCKENGKTVKLMTVHQSKGLEFPYVFVCGLSEGVFPSHRALRERKIKALEEERRLMYVAITRAEKGLYLTEGEGFNFQTRTDKYPSRFLTEIKKNYLIQEGHMDETLWNGSKLLADAIDAEIADKPKNEEITPGVQVNHQFFGDGIVQSISEDGVKCKVRFGADETTDRFIILNALTVLDK